MFIALFLIIQISLIAAMLGADISFSMRFILFVIFNIYYYIIVKKIYYLFTINDKNNIPKIDKGPCVYWYKLLLNSR